MDAATAILIVRAIAKGVATYAQIRALAKRAQAGEAITQEEADAATDRREGVEDAWDKEN